MHNIPHITIENTAEYINGVGADTFVPLQPCDLTGADAVFFDQRILGDSFFFHDVPQVIK